MICNKCGNAVEHNAHYCEKCGNQVRREPVRTDLSQVKLREENYFLGTLGALLGGAAGVLIFYQWYMFFSTQFLAPLPGALLGALTAGGYWWLGRQLKVVGTAVAVVLTLVAGWLANHIFWVLVVYTNGISGIIPFWDVFTNLTRFTDAGDITLEAYLMGLTSIYFGALTAVAITVAAYRNLAGD